jgi:hypothetical protein
MIKGVFHFNQSPFGQWFMTGLVIGLFMMVWFGQAQANGGTTFWIEEVGVYDLTITASPFPLQVGVNDISVLLGRQSDSQIVLEAEILITAQPLDHAGRPQIFSATHANATNKLYYAANVDFPTPGRWQLLVQVDGPEGSISTAFEVQVEPAQPFNFLRYVSLIGLPFVAIVFLFFVLSRRAGKEFNEELEEED